MKISPTETEIVGRWVQKGTQVKGDDATLRIEELVAQHLRRLSQTDGGWSVLYEDPSDGRRWELTYPASSSHGGGAPRLVVVVAAEAEKMRYES